MKNKINEVSQHGHPKEEQWSPKGSFFTRGGLLPINHSCRRNSYKLQDPEPSPWDTGFLRRSFQNWMLGICMYCIGRKLLLTSPLFWDTLWFKSFWEKMASVSLPSSLFTGLHQELLGHLGPKQRSRASSKGRESYALKNACCERGSVCRYLRYSCYLTSPIKRWELDAFFQPSPFWLHTANIVHDSLLCYFCLINASAITTCLRKMQIPKYTLSSISVFLLDHEIHLKYFPQI